MRSTSPPRTRSPVGSREENQPIRYSILYEVVDESDVEVVELPNATGNFLSMQNIMTVAIKSPYQNSEDEKVKRINNANNYAKDIFE